MHAHHTAANMPGWCAGSMCTGQQQQQQQQQCSPYGSSVTGEALGTLFHSLWKMLPSAVVARGLTGSSAADTGPDACRVSEEHR
jgi:hypothetical protein